MRALNEIIIHCSATRADWMRGAKTSAKVAEIKLWHTRDRGWKDIGYHYLIDRDGTLAAGRPVGQVGAHVQGRNAGTIGVCLIGGHGSSEKDQFGDHFTPAQDKMLRKLLADLMREHPTITKISGHNQYAAKACPGFNAPSWYAKARAEHVKKTPETVTRSAPHVKSPTSALVVAVVAAIVAWMMGAKDFIATTFGG